MILPIIAYGDPLLRKKGIEINKNYPGLTALIENMFDTMHFAHGVGLAAPQVGKSINLFILDTTTMDEEKNIPMKKVFINTEILEETGVKWEYEEGCLSIPLIRENVSRQPVVRIKYMDENFVQHEETFDGMPARVIQHEFDHVKGILFVDHITEFKRRLLKNKLLNISKGNIEIGYRMKFPSGR
ncbi:MAG: peptide deformylase [Bacteroidia bacterium]